MVALERIQKDLNVVFHQIFDENWIKNRRNFSSYQECFRIGYTQKPVSTKMCKIYSKMHNFKSKQKCECCTFTEAAVILQGIKRQYLIDSRRALGNQAILPNRIIAHFLILWMQQQIHFFGVVRKLRIYVGGSYIF